MKIEAKRAEDMKPFEPLRIELTIESQREFNVLHFIFNYQGFTAIINEYANIDDDAMRAGLSSVGTNGDFEVLEELIKKRR